MAHFSTLTRTGQTTVPKAVREALGLAPRQRIEYVLEEDGGVYIRPAARSLLDSAGALADQQPTLQHRTERARARKRRAKRYT